MDKASEFDRIMARKHQLLQEEATQPEQWWWLSFADHDGFRGGVLTKARGFISAIQKATELEINPGGAVRGMPCNPPPEHLQYADQLLSYQDVKEKLGPVERWPS